MAPNPTDPRSETNDTDDSELLDGFGTGTVHTHLYVDSANLEESVISVWPSLADAKWEPIETIRADTIPNDASLDTGTYSSSVADVHLVERSLSDIGVVAAKRSEYELVRVLGTGGMGVVYQARQTSINRTVALKTMRPTETPSPKLDRNFLEEALVTGDLNHPNIVPIHDLGRTSDGTLFYAMKEVRGIPWTDVIGSNSVDENLTILMRVADAIAFAHSRGVIHRDLKPANVMLGEFGEVLVLDWGMALPLASRTGPVSLGGTPRYMAPEMVTGPGMLIGPHSDVYLLGALLFEIVCGTGPHVGKTPKETLLAVASNTIVEVDASKCAGELLNIAYKAMRTDPTERFESVIRFQAALHEYQAHSESIALAGRANELFRQAQESGDYDKFAHAAFGFQNALELWSQNAAARECLVEVRAAYASTALTRGDFDLGLSILSDPSTDEELRQSLISGREERDARQSRVLRLKRLARNLAAAIAVVLIVAVVWISKAERTASRERDIAQEQERLALRNFNLARDAVDEMLREVGREDLAHVPHMSDVRRRLSTKALGFYKQFLNVDVDDNDLRFETAIAYHHVGDISELLGEHDEARAAYNNAIKLYASLIPQTSESALAARIRWQLADCHDDLGELHRKTDSPQEAESAYDASATILRQLIADDPTMQRQLLLARSLYNKGLLFWSVDRPDDAGTSFNEAIQILAELQKQEAKNPDVRHALARVHVNRGVYYRGTGKAESARADYDSANDLYTALLAEFPFRTDYRVEFGQLCNNLGNLLSSSKDTHELAQQVFTTGEQVLQLLAHEFPSEVGYQLEWANALNGLGSLHFSRKQQDEADKAWQRSREIMTKLVESHPDVPQHQSVLARPLTNLGWLEYVRADYAASQRFMRLASRHHKLALDGNPDNRDFRAFLKNSTLGLAMSSLKLADHAGVGAAAEGLLELSPDDAGECYSAALYFARCLPLVEQAADLDDARKVVLNAGYRSRAIKSLEKAVANGFSSVGKLETDEGWSPLRSNAEFQRLEKAIQVAAEKTVDPQ